LQSPLLWDAASVTAYFLGSVTYLYIPLIPDLALLRDNTPEDASRWRRRFYSTFALGWRGNRTQWLRLEKVIAVLAILIIPVAISVHTIISWILATNTQPGWHSTVFGPYFVVGAIYSGIAALFIAMTIVRRAMHLEDYITDRQYRNLGYIFIAISATWFYFTFAEYLTLAAGQQKTEFPVLAAKLWGQYLGTFWGMVLLMGVAFWVMVAPQLAPSSIGGWFLFRGPIRIVMLAVAVLAVVAVAIPIVRESLLSFVNGMNLGLITVVVLLLAGISNLMWLKRHLVSSMMIASVCVLVGMWLERWNIIAPTMSFPRLMPSTTYTPTFTEWSLLAASVALFVLLFAIFFKLFPPVSVWEVAEGRVIETAEAHVEIPMPEVYVEGASS
jgi:molybdopterin-containing oxidoreductase family membrane subunit